MHSVSLTFGILAYLYKPESFCISCYSLSDPDEFVEYMMTDSNNWLLYISYMLYNVYHITQFLRIHESISRKAYSMAVHHFITGCICAILLLNSHMERVASFIVIIHGIADIPYYISKVMRNINFRGYLYNYVRLTWAFLFIVTRVFVYGYITIVVVYKSASKDIAGMYNMSILITLILIMQIYWSWLIVVYIIKKGIKSE